MKFLFTSAKRTSPLWGNRDFMSFWIAQSISEIGSRITREGLPLAAVLTLGATPMMMAWLQVTTAIPVLILGFVVGALLDRLPRRPFLIASDVLRGCLLLIVPVAAVTGILKMWVLFAVSASVGILTLIFTIAYEAYVPTLVGQDRLVDGNTKLSITSSFAEIVGPGLAGTLVQAITAPFAILLDSFTYFCSAFYILRIRSVEPHVIGKPHSARHFLKEIVDGFRTIANVPILRSLVTTAAFSSFFAGIIFTLDVLYALHTLHLGAALFGFTIMFGGVGALFGASLCQRLVRRFGYGRVLVGAALLSGVLSSLIPLASGSRWHAALFLIGWQLFGDCFGVIFGILESSLRQAVTEDHMLGRVNATFNLLTATLSPLGALFGGWVSVHFSLRAAMAVGAVGMTLAVGALFIAPLWRIADVAELSSHT